MGRKKHWVIPVELMVKAVQETADELGGKPGIDKWMEKERVLCRSKLPPEYQHVESDLILDYAMTIRKNPDKYGYKSPNKKSMGRGGKKQSPQWYCDYLKSDHWQAVRKAVLMFWEGRCALCQDCERIEIHHNNYDCLGLERLNDVIAICHRCHSRYHYLMPDCPDQPSKVYGNGHATSLFP